MAVWEYGGSLGSGFDDSLKKENVFDGQVYARPAVSASVSGDRLSVVVPDIWLWRDRYVVFVDGNPIAEMRDNVSIGVDLLESNPAAGLTTFLFNGVHAGERLQVRKYDGPLQSGLDDALLKGVVLDQQP